MVRSCVSSKQQVFPRLRPSVYPFFGKSRLSPTPATPKKRKKRVVGFCGFAFRHYLPVLQLCNFYMSNHDNLYCKSNALARKNSSHFPYFDRQTQNERLLLVVIIDICNKDTNLLVFYCPFICLLRFQKGVGILEGLKERLCSFCKL